MAGMGHEYDSYNRSLPTVFVGEFAANVGHNKTLRAAVAEAVFMLGFEANGDVVKSASFAPVSLDKWWRQTRDILTQFLAS